MPDTTVKYFDSTIAGAPELTSDACALIALLDACLVTGFGSVTLDSLAVSGEVATGTLSTGHGFEMIGGLVGPVIEIAGATAAGLNGQWRLASADTNTFTFACPGVADGAASGTITAKRAPLGWSKAFSGTNLAAYRSSELSATGMLLRIDDTNTYAGWNTYGENVRATAVESMTGIDTWDGQFGDSMWRKHASAGGTANEWHLIGDESLFYRQVKTDSGDASCSIVCFGDIFPQMSNDAYHCIYTHYDPGAPQNVCGTYFAHANGSTSGRWMARSYDQVTQAIQVAMRGHRITSYLGQGGYDYPNPEGSALLGQYPLTIDENNTVRGTMPGLVQILQTPSVANGYIAAPPSGGSPMIVLKCGLFNSLTYGAAAFLLEGPWR